MRCKGDNMIKMIVLDMDGTLLNYENRILEETREALWKVQQKGVRLVLASGRGYTRLMPYAKQLGMHQYGGYLVEINGTAIYDVKRDIREVLAQISVEQTKELFQYFMQWDVEVVGQIDRGMYCYMSEKLHKEKELYRIKHQICDDMPWTGGPYDLICDSRDGYPNIMYIHSIDEITQTVNKVSATYHEDVMAHIRKKAQEDLCDRYWLGLASKRWLEVMPKGVSKASGLRKVSQATGISFDEMMSFGDSENDVEMLKATGISIVMGNALDEVKKYADRITDTNERNGIAKALYSYFTL